MVFLCSPSPNPQVKMPVGVSIKWESPALTGSISAEITWSRAYTMLDKYKPSCAQHYSIPGAPEMYCYDSGWIGYICTSSGKHAFYNGDHIVLRGQLKVTVGLTVTAGVDLFLAGAEARVEAKAEARLDTAFTRINKCWRSGPGLMRTGVADGFASVTTATIDLSVSYVWAVHCRVQAAASRA